MLLKWAIRYGGRFMKTTSALYFIFARANAIFRHAFDYTNPRIRAFKRNTIA